MNKKFEQGKSQKNGEFSETPKNQERQEMHAEAFFEVEASSLEEIAGGIIARGESEKKRISELSNLPEATINQVDGKLGTKGKLASIRRRVTEIIGKLGLFSKSPIDKQPTSEIRERRKEQAKELREKAIDQKMKLMEITGKVFECLEASPDIQAEELIANLKKDPVFESLNPEYQELAERTLELMGSRMTVIDRLVKENKNPETGELDPGAVYATCFGRRPIGRIQMHYGAGLLFFKTEDYNDFDFAALGLHLRESKEPTIFEKLAMIGKAGVNLTPPLVEGLRNSVTLENAWFQGTFDVPIERTRGIFAHEARHHLDLLLLRARFGEEGYRDFLKRKITGKIIEREEVSETVKKYDELADLNEADREEKLERMSAKEREDYASYVRTFNNIESERRTALEIAAFYAEEKLLSTIPEYFLDKDSPYRFGFNYRSKGENGNKENVSESFRRLVKNGVEALRIMENKGYSKEQVQAAIFGERLSSWPKIAERIKEVKTLTAKRDYEQIAA